MRGAIRNERLRSAGFLTSECSCVHLSIGLPLFLSTGELLVPRAKYVGGEVDGNLKIEDAVRQTLKSNSIATVSAKAIENVYDLYDEELPSEQRSLEDKCHAIAKEAGADFFEVKGLDHLVSEEASLIGSSGAAGPSRR